MIAGCYVYSAFYNSTTCCSEVFSDDYAVYHQGRCVSSRFSRLFLAVNQIQPGDYSGLSVILQEDQQTFGQWIWWFTCSYFAERYHSAFINFMVY